MLFRGGPFFRGTKVSLDLPRMSSLVSEHRVASASLVLALVLSGCGEGSIQTTEVRSSTSGAATGGRAGTAGAARGAPRAPAGARGGGRGGAGVSARAAG